MPDAVVFVVVGGVVVVVGVVLALSRRGNFRFRHGRTVVEAEGEAPPSTRMSIKAEGAAQVTNNTQRVTRPGNKVLEIEGRGDAVVDGNLMTDETQQR